MLGRIQRREIHCGVIGLGYVGLPLALEFARAGFRTVGIDVNAEKVRQLQAGRSYIVDVRDPEIDNQLRARRFTATTDYTVLRNLDVITICVPTPLGKTKDPDLSYIEEAVGQVRDGLRSGQLIILESTTYPGTTEDVVRPILEQSGLKAGEDFCLAFSPERIDPGNGTWNTRTIPKVVGGLTLHCTAMAVGLYRTIVNQVVPVSSPRVAEMVKLLENTFRTVNVALANEMALLCNAVGLDVWEVIEAAKTKPFGFMPFYPGPGLGGHCLPIDPFYLSWTARQSGFEPRFIELAGYVNESMPRFVVEKVTAALASRQKAVRGARIHCVGVAYKAGVNDVRESPALNVMRLLRDKGAVLSYDDPYVPKIEQEDLVLTAEPTPLLDVDCVVILTAHPGIDWWQIAAGANLIIDTRDALHQFRGPNIIRL